ncbi:hypothetical protein MLD38_022537 [Melastoma candidum]|uniref:Uncharacterized protein n=1 Tax=Melastoma candidum TaxID=119954 RepID=A0ACB9QJL8_9MYRT|nr:hypothetical protein MLD38_022537 [Melastoma candidum]
MENYPIRPQEEEDDSIELPPGFRFHPTDEELITHYLSPKVLDCGFPTRVIGEVDLNRVEPWELPWRAKMGEKEWYFFCVKDRKYPTGLRTNRATDAGYWKATGKDKEIYRMKALVGMKKTLVFYKGRAPKGVKTNWVMHEYRLEGPLSRNFHQYSKNEWVICRVFQKTTGGKRIEFPGLIRPNKLPNATSVLPPPTDSSPYNCNSDTTTAGVGDACTSHVACFSDLVEDAATANTLQHEDSPASNVIVGTQSSENQQDSSILCLLMQQSYSTNQLRGEFAPAASCFDIINGGGHPQHHERVDIDCYWQY